MHTLLIWEEVPERTSLFLIPNTVLTEEERKILHTAHGHHINADEVTKEEDKALSYINDALCENKEHCSPSSKRGGWATKWHKHKTEDRPLENVGVTHVYRCGFVM